MRVQPVPTGGLPVAFHITTGGDVSKPVSASGSRRVKPGDYLPERGVNRIGDGGRPPGRRCRAVAAGPWMRAVDAGYRELVGVVSRLVLPVLRAERFS